MSTLPAPVSPSRRSAMTLIELIVCICIVVAIAALAAAFLPRLGTSHRVANAANSVQSWMLQAKMRAKRDRLPTGMRLLVDRNTPGSVSTLQWIQQGEDFTAAGAKLTGKATWIPHPDAPAMWLLIWTVTQLDAKADFSNSHPEDPALWLAKPGDYFSFAGGAPMRILSGTPATPPEIGVVWTVTQGAASPTKPPQPPQDIAPTDQWKVMRRAYPLLGEPEMKMPSGVVLDTWLSGAGGAGFGSVLPAAPAGAVSATSPYAAAYDLTFSPRGALQQGSGTLVLWVRDAGKQFDRSGTVSLTTQIQAPGGTDDQALVGISSQTGSVRCSSVNGSIAVLPLPDGDVQAVAIGTPGSVYTPFLSLQYPKFAD